MLICCLYVHAGTPPLGSTTRAISFPGLTQINSGGHTLVVTVTPNDPAFPVQTQERGYRVGKQYILLYVHVWEDPLISMFISSIIIHDVV